MPTTRITIDASLYRTGKHERRIVVIRVRGCRMTEIQAQLYGMQTQHGVLFL